MRRLTPATLTLFMFLIVGLLVVGYVAKTMLAGQTKPPAPPVMRDAPMAISDIAPGTVITENHLGVGRIQRDKLEPDMLLTNRVIVGRVAKTPIKSATPIKANQLYQPGELPPLEVAAGMRAVSVEVGDGVAMVDGMIKPGQYVDILFTSQGSGTLSDNTFQGGLTMRLFEGVKILAINRNYTQSRVERGSNHVTLELTEAQANIVVLARDRGRLTLTYNPSNAVGNGGLALSNSERVTFYEILGLRKQDPAKEPFQTEIFRGNSNRSVNTYDDRGRFMGSNYTAAPPTNNNNPQYVMPNDAGANGSGPANNNRSNAPAPNSNQPARTQGQPINNGNGPRTPTAALPANTLN